MKGVLFAGVGSSTIIIIFIGRFFFIADAFSKIFIRISPR